MIALKRLTLVFSLVGVLAAGIASHMVLAQDVESLKEATKAQLKWDRQHTREQSAAFAQIGKLLERLNTNVEWLKKEQLKHNGGSP